MGQITFWIFVLAITGGMVYVYYKFFSGASSRTAQHLNDIQFGRTDYYSIEPEDKVDFNPNEKVLDIKDMPKHDSDRWKKQDSGN